MPNGGDRDVEAGLIEFDRSRRYILAEYQDVYGVWEVGREFAPPLASFPADDDDGFELATDEFDRLTKADRRTRRHWITVLWWTTLISAPVWIVSSAARQLYLGYAYNGFGKVNILYAFITLVSVLSYGVLYSGALILVGTYAYRRLRGEL